MDSAARRTPEQVAARLGAAIRGSAPALAPASRGRPVVVPPEVIRALQPHASRRGMRVETLLRALLDEVAHGDMVDAILDGRAGGGGR